MDQHTYENWLKIKTTFEDSGNTDNMFYKRACEIAKTKNDEFVSRIEVQEMIDDAIRRHNRNASIISMCVGWVVLALFAEGLLRLVGVIPPLLPWLNITLK